MRKLRLASLLFLYSQLIVCQTSIRVSIDFDNVNRVDALLKLENLIDYDFYFERDWFNDSTISKSFNNAEIETIVEAVLEDTSINYLIFDGRIILTKNNAITTKLPDNFFDTESETIKDGVKVPILQKQFINNRASNSKEVFAIGKENRKNSNGKFLVSGYIKDLKTGKPIENITVFLKDKSANSTTNSLGFYSLEVPSGFNILEASSLSYGKSEKQIVVYGAGTFSFFLEEQVEQLGEVLIESNRDDNIKKAEVGVTRIDVQGIKNIPLVLGERDVLKVATTMPGIKTAGEGALGYNVRGGKADQNLILFDNAVMYNPSHFFGVFSAINPFATGSVNIYKGSIPAEFGGRLSSVIDISTKEANMEKFSGEGNIGPITGNLMIETPIVKDKISILAGVRATYSDWVLKAISEESIKNSKASFYDAVVKYNHKINDKNDLQATAYYSNDKFSITSDSVYNYSNRLASIKWSHIFDDKNRASIQLATSQYKFNIIYDGIFNRNFDFGYNINETQFKIIAKYLYSKEHKFSYGLSSKLYAIQPGDIKPLGGESVVESKSVDRERGLESAIFISDLFEVNKKLLIDIGFRYSFYAALGEGTQNVYDPTQPKSLESIVETKTYGKNEVIKTYGGPEIRFSARYFLSPNVSIKGGYNNTIQYSHLLSTNTTASPVDSWKLSDLNIEPQRAEQYSLGIYKNFEDDSHELSIEGYYKKMNNLLDFKVGAELLLNQNIETELLQGQGKAYGVEMLLKKKKGRLNGWLGYSYSRTLVKLDSEFLTNQVNSGDYFSANQDRPHDVSVISNYKLTKRYSLSLNFNYQSGRPITYPVGKYVYNGNEQVLYSDRNKFRIPDYYRVDLGVNIEGNHKNVKLAHSFWNISVYNVLGRNNPHSVFFVNENGKIKGYKSSIFSVPIPTITYNFKF
ncbi:carboxypeptidase-like regulatory domain-containing protein [Mariniflexile sp. HMF6888]|uniref:TonB-dependent receptor n=1 Tax=Mariniflexile sp. HMF6888 TaxID=3373086 RepID=UPI0037A9A5DF